VISEIRAQVIDPGAAEPEPEVVVAAVEPPAGQTSAQPAAGSARRKAGASEPAESGDAQPLPGEVPLSWALGDETLPFSDPQATLNPDKPGWGSKPRLTHPRRLVLVPREPVSLTPGTRLRLTVRQEDAPNDLAPFVMNRSRYALANDDRWIELVRGTEFVARQETGGRLRKERDAIPGEELPVMADQDDGLSRVTAVYSRGDWLNKEEVVAAGVPALFVSAPADRELGTGREPPSTREETSGARPHTDAERENRLTLARGLVSPQNPLTARVTVNRFWEQLFGTGLVETSEDFGPAGQPPSHPELLDDLAWRFQHEMGWSMKRLLRELVLSATYRQAATVTEELRTRDPRNRLLARGPRIRLSAEMVRDNALALSGLLSETMYGPSVMPPQPDGIWRAARSSLKWKTDEGERRYRRAIYTYWRRSSPYPSLLAFDAPNRLVCAARRTTTNTPLQALVTLNDPVYMEAAVAFARRMNPTGGLTANEAIARGYQWAAGSAPTPDDLKDLLSLHAQALAWYEAEPEQAKLVAASPSEAALTLVANAILNLDVVLTR
jgi:hypothetical protein